MTVTDSVPTLTRDLRLMDSVFTMEARKVRRGQDPYTEMMFPLSVATLARYEAAREGRVFDPSSLDALFPNKVARRRNEFPIINVDIERARDIFLVLDQLVATGDLTGTDQLPANPLKYVLPLNIVNSLVNRWTTEIQGGNRPVDAHLKQKLEVVASLLLYEAHPDRQELDVPRRRKFDVDIDTPLLPNTIERLRDVEEQKLFTELGEVSEFDFVIAKSAVHAFLTLARQHDTAIDIAGIPELYRRGLFPLSLLTNNDNVMDSIALIIGRKKEDIYDAISRVEETHRFHRSTSLEKVLEIYDRRVTQIELERIEKATLETERREEIAREIQADFDRELHMLFAQECITELEAQADQVRERTHSSLANGSQFSRVVGSKNISAALAPAEEILNADNLVDEILHTTTAVILDTSEFARLMTHALDYGLVTDKSSFLPIVKTPRTEQGEMEHTPLALTPANLWYIGVVVNLVPAPEFEAKVFLGPQGLMRAAIQTEADRKIGSIYAFINARTTDIFSEAALVHMITRDVMANDDRSQNYVEAIETLHAIAVQLDAGHMNTICAVRDISLFAGGICDTSEKWKKLSQNPLIQKPVDPHHEMLGIPEDELMAIAMYYHLPPEMTGMIVTGQVNGLNLHLTKRDVQRHQAEVKANDTTGKMLKIARNVRRSFGTGGERLRNRADSIEMGPLNKLEVAHDLRTVAARYSLLFRGVGPHLRDPNTSITNSFSRLPPTHNVGAVR